MKSIEGVMDEVKGRVLPTEAEKERMLRDVEAVKAQIESAFAKTAYPVEILIEGSVAKDTWLRREMDVDIFVRFPPQYSKEEIAGVTISMSKGLWGEGRCEERYAEHPFVTAHVKDKKFDIVPCFDSKPGEWKSATDRTPYHTEYVKANLSGGERDEVRFLKRFAKGIGIYGAEIKVGGFSGLLCELLVHHFHSFKGTIEAMAALKPPLLIDPMGYYLGREEEARGAFNANLIVVDPSDERRNVAAAVTQTKLSEMIAASTAFLKDPSANFFFPARRALGGKQLSRAIRREGRQLLALELGAMNAPPDIFWGQLYSARDKILGIMRNADFTVTRIMAWTDEGSCSFILMELESRMLSPLRQKAGPPVGSPHTRRYMDIYASGRDVVGPWIQGERFYIMVRRRYVDASAYLKRAVFEYARTGGMPSLLVRRLRGGVKVLVDGQIATLARNREAAQTITEFLDGRPVWMMGTRPRRRA
jgi:tRNA nucleotidyltransferase (CCA-adding enzyme)